MSPTLNRDKPLTADAFYDYCAGRFERIDLVNGRIVEMPPASTSHGEYDSNLVSELARYVKINKLGKTYLNTGFILRNSPDLVRGPDEAFVSAPRIAANPPPPKGFWRIAPDFVVEIVSPDDSADDINDKVNDYLDHGVRLIWVIYPRRKQAHVFRPGCPNRVVNADGKLEGEDVVPGFEVALSQILG